MTAALEITPAPLETTQPTSLEVCSPLENFPLAQLTSPDLLKNSYAPPRPGYDDGHFGVDFSYWSDTEGNPMLGLPVHALLPGRIAGRIENRQPYGYALIIETPLERFSSDQLGNLELPTPTRDLQPALGLSCPDYRFTVPSDSLSIYTLYAHLDQTPTGEIGADVACGQAIGLVGTTGRSVNPHLHLETRTGPPGMLLGPMAHYDNSAAEDEMRLYCLWRISGAFPSFDPFQIIALALP